MKFNTKSLLKWGIFRFTSEDELKSFDLGNGVIVRASELEMDAIVIDADENLYSNKEFTFEGKVYKTNENGAIISIEDAVADTKEVEMTEDVTTDNSSEEIEKLRNENAELKLKIKELEDKLSESKDELVNLSKQTKGINLNKQVTQLTYEQTALERMVNAMKKNNNK